MIHDENNVLMDGELFVVRDFKEVKIFMPICTK